MTGRRGQGAGEEGLSRNGRFLDRPGVDRGSHEARGAALKTVLKLAWGMGFNYPLSHTYSKAFGCMVCLKLGRARQLVDFIKTSSIFPP